jgi:Family of unknown function (DUF5343)
MPTTSKLPYINAYGNIGKALVKIRTAATPDRFSQDFLEKTLGMGGGGSRPLIPLFKRIGFLGSDGTPTELYKQFRNSDLSSGAMARALKIGYAPLYEMDEEVHKRDSAKIKNLVVQATGSEASAPSVRATVKSFEALNEFADFKSAGVGDDKPEDDSGGGDDGTPEDEDGGGNGLSLGGGVNLGYTINLHLPATSDVGVYNAIFRSLRENLLRDLE